MRWPAGERAGEKPPTGGPLGRPAIFTLHTRGVLGRKASAAGVCSREAVSEAMSSAGVCVRDFWIRELVIMGRSSRVPSIANERDCYRRAT